MKMPSVPLLSDTQLVVLRLAAKEKLERTLSGWLSRRTGFIYSTSTVLSLWARGIMQTDFDDPRGLCCKASFAQLMKELGPHKVLHVWPTEEGMALLRLYG